MRLSLIKVILLDPHFVIIRSPETMEKEISFKISILKVLIIILPLLFMFGIAFHKMISSSEKLLFFFEDKYASQSQLSESQAIIDSLQQQTESLIVTIELQANFIEAIEYAFFDSTETKKPSTELPLSNTISYASVDTPPIDTLIENYISDFEDISISDYSYSRRIPEKINFNLFNPIQGGLIVRNFTIATQHFGIDIVAKKNQPITSIANGIVILSNWTQAFGHIIAVQHEDYDLVSIYKHNSVLLKQTGDRVKKGEAIAVIGNSGEYTQGNHLHFEVWSNGKAIDPKKIINF